MPRGPLLFQIYIPVHHVASPPLMMEPNPPCIPSFDPESVFVIKATRVPNVSELRRRLACASNTLPHDKSLYTAICTYPLTFTSEQGENGVALTKWSDIYHRKALLKMTEDFLDRDRNGVLFWPNDSTSSQYRNIQYSTHRGQ